MTKLSAKQKERMLALIAKVEKMFPDDADKQVEYLQLLAELQRRRLDG